MHMWGMILLYQISNYVNTILYRCNGMVKLYKLVFLTFVIDCLDYSYSCIMQTHTYRLRVTLNICFMPLYNCVAPRYNIYR